MKPASETGETAGTIARPQPESVLGYLPALVAITLIAAALRFFHLTTQDLWLDEIGTVLAATSIGGAEGTSLDPSLLPTAWLSTFYYAVLKLLLLIFDADAGVVARVFSALIGAATVPAIAWTASQLMPRGAALGAAALTALSPFHVWYSQEGRPYALLILLATVAAGAYLRALDTKAAKWWAAFSVCSALALYTHPVGIMLPAACFVSLLANPGPHGRESVLRGVGALAVAGVLYIPAVLTIASTGLNNPADPRPVTVLDIPYALYTYCVGFSLGPNTSQLHESAQVVLEYLPAVTASALVFGVVVLAGLVHTARHVEQRALVLSWLVLPLAGVFVLAALTANPFNPRYTITAYPALVLVAAAGGWALFARGGKLLAYAVMTGVAAVSIWSLGNLYFDDHYSKEASGRLGGYLDSATGPEDLVLVNAPYMEMPVGYYYTGEAEVRGYPRGGKSADEVTADEIRELISGRPQVWLVLSRTFHGDREGRLRELLGDHLRETDEQGFPGIVAYRFTPRP